jgi:hypothetical protein
MGNSYKSDEPVSKSMFSICPPTETVERYSAALGSGTAATLPVSCAAWTFVLFACPPRSWKPYLRYAFTMAFGPLEGDRRLMLRRTTCLKLRFCRVGVGVLKTTVANKAAMKKMLLKECILTFDKLTCSTWKYSQKRIGIYWERGKWVGVYVEYTVLLARGKRRQRC